MVNKYSGRCQKERNNIHIFVDIYVVTDATKKHASSTFISHEEYEKERQPTSGRKGRINPGVRTVEINVRS